MATPVIMPRLGQSVESCLLVSWMKKKGDRVAKGDLLFSYETDKAAFEEEAQVDGLLLDVFFEEGDEIPVLSTLAVLGHEGEDISEFTPLQPQADAGASSTPDTPNEKGVKAISHDSQTGRDPGHIAISPRAKKLAVSYGFDVSALQGSGPGGRIVEDDVKRFAEKYAAHSIPVSSSLDEYDTEKLSHVRKIIARSMHESLQSTAQVTLHSSADARKLIALRNDIKKHKSDETGPDITISVLVCFAVVSTLKKHKNMNAHMLDDEIRFFNCVHLGIAVDTPRGLMVPTIHHADTMRPRELSERMRTVADQCKTGSIDPELLHGATFTVTNLGPQGIEMFTPILNPPQVGVLGINAITLRPRSAENGSVEFVPCIGLSLTFDHRALDGAPAAAFLHDLSDCINHIDTEVWRSVIQA